MCRVNLAQKNKNKNNNISQGVFSIPKNSLDKNKLTQGIIIDGTAVVEEQRLCGNKALSRICENIIFFCKSEGTALGVKQVASPSLQVLDGVRTEE